MKDRIIAEIKIPFCQLIKTKYQGYAVKTAVGTSFYSQKERPIAFLHFRNEMRHQTNRRAARSKRMKQNIYVRLLKNGWQWCGSSAHRDVYRKGRWFCSVGSSVVFSTDREFIKGLN